MDNLSRYGREERNDSDVVRGEDTGMGTAAGGQEIVPVHPTRLEGASNSPPQRVHDAP